MTDKTIPRRSRRLGLRRLAAPAIEVPKPLAKAIQAAGAAIDKLDAGASKKPATNTQAKSPAPLPPLNVKQHLFVQHYLICRNATHAAEKAGYSVKSARVNGPRLLSHPAVAAEIRRKTEKTLEKIEISRERIQTELARMGLANMGDYMKVGPTGAPVTDFSNLSRDQTAALQEITVEEFTDGRSDKRQVRRVKFKLADKVNSLMALGKDLGMFTETHKHQHTHTLVGTLLDEIDQAGRGAKLIEQMPQEKSNG